MHKPIILLPIENEYSVEELTFIFRQRSRTFSESSPALSIVYSAIFHHILVESLNKHIRKSLNVLLETSIDHSFLSSKQETSEYLNLPVK